MSLYDIARTPSVAASDVSHINSRFELNFATLLTRHPWSDSVHVAIDLEAMGIGGKSAIFQAGPHPWAIETFAASAKTKYPSAQIVAQDLFSSGAIKSATDFQIYKEVAGLSGLDFAWVDDSIVYHTKDASDYRTSKEFKNEVLTLSSVEHLNFVRCYGYLKHGHELIIIVEYVSNGTLTEHLNGLKGDKFQISDKLRHRN